MLRHLGRLLALRRLQGTLLLLGERGLGKTTLATIIARALTCERNGPSATEAPRLWFCGECYACRSIAAGQQPEYVMIRPLGQDIKKEQLDEKSGALYGASLHPAHLSHRVYVIDEAHCLNETTSNQLLKLLEEPPRRTVFILVTDKPQLLLPTIHSRGMRINLLAEPPARLATYLTPDLPGISGEGIAEAALMAAGRYVDARALALDPAWRASVASLAEALGTGSGLLDRAARAAEYELAFLWTKELADLGLDMAEAEKLIDKARLNELKRQALITAYDRAALWLVRHAPPARGFAPAYFRLTARIRQNVDPLLAQAAFSVELAADGGGRALPEQAGLSR